MLSKELIFSIYFSKYLANNLVDFFLNNNIIIIDYRAQSYAKSSNMS